MSHLQGRGGECVAVRGSQGLCLQQPPEYAIHQGFQPDQSKAVKVMAFSSDGGKIAWSNMVTVQVASLEADGSWRVHVTLDQPKVYTLAWSPLGKWLATWEQYSVVQGQEPKPNLHIWDSSSGERRKSFFQRKMSNWCPAWTRDEGITSRMVNNEVQFYEGGDLDAIVHKIHLKKVEDYSQSSLPTPHVVTYVPGAKGAPSACRLYKYPAFEDTQVVANKSFFQADKVEMKWNNAGSAVLLLTQAEVDKTGSSYYGKQQLHFMSVRGDTSMVGLPKEGPIYSVEWADNSQCFSVVYGFMPAKATLFNIKAEPTYDFGTGPRNTALFNPQSSLLLIGGFGNLRGKVEIWDVGGKCKVSEFEAPDSTDVKWGPCGQLIMTSTCAPRLRQGNGYKVWHYTGALKHQKFFQSTDELYEVQWQESASHPPFSISAAPVSGLSTEVKPAAKQAYRPPGARAGGPALIKPLSGDLEQAGHVKLGVAGVCTNTNAQKEQPLSKSAAKNKKRKEAAKRAAVAADPSSKSSTNEQKDALQVAKDHHREDNNKYQGAAGMLADPEKEKKLRKLNDKLSAINKLKDKQAAGEQLEKNQIEKLSKETELLQELKALQLS